MPHFISTIPGLSLPEIIFILFSSNFVIPSSMTDTLKHYNIQECSTNTIQTVSLICTDTLICTDKLPTVIFEVKLAKQSILYLLAMFAEISNVFY